MVALANGPYHQFTFLLQSPLNNNKIAIKPGLITGRVECAQSGVGLFMVNPTFRTSLAMPFPGMDRIFVKLEIRIGIHGIKAISI